MLPSPPTDQQSARGISALGDELERVVPRVTLVVPSGPAVETEPSGAAAGSVEAAAAVKSGRPWAADRRRTVFELEGRLLVGQRDHSQWHQRTGAFAAGLPGIIPFNHIISAKICLTYRT